MTSVQDSPTTVAHFAQGGSCLLNVMDEHFLVRILQVNGDHLEVTFPGRDYPVPGMRVYLEFHDEEGFDSYPSHVLRGPQENARYLVLEMPRSGRRTLHRTSCRIPTDLTVQVRDHAYVRRYDAALINLSSGGALIRTEAPFDFSTTVELSLSLPGEPSHSLLGQVVHLSLESADRSPGARRIYGVRFLSPASEVVISLNRYLSQRLKSLYPTSERT